MTCWDILGIEPTDDLERIRQAYERQTKFASEDEARALEHALQEAMGDVPPVRESAQSRVEDLNSAPNHAEAVAPDEEYELDATEAQIAREVVIQIKALMNDDHRQQDAGIWKAILCEPPADELAMRREIGRQLEPRVRPMAENGAFSVAVTRFLGDWFDWSSVRSASPVADSGNPDSEHVDPRNSDLRNSDLHNDPESDMAPEQPPMTNFWPAVIGWIVGLVILATIFGGMGG
ncbi:molecular chaperone DnaJ [Marinobacter halophilus]|uniref:Molecular chaperone DnaJ n=1 Tax=Marinobacter halophilus TaxID=1323740 RepID=A0A2T1K7Z4_9GAMM|nr:molecular chaperone DnaJ [Marinobacter halophilus]PSF06269.1 molecular chaperone DnaJ [Marinobacter halophilus]GGC71175.1 hypothetical protein GCM10011362_19530 [Marinobacter halophilus]